MTHLVVEELESRTLLSASALALIPSPAPAVPAWAAKADTAEHMERCGILLVPGADCQVVMDRHLASNASGSSAAARQQAAVLCDAEAPSEFDDRLSPQSAGPQENAPEPQGARTGPRPELPRPALPQAGPPPVLDRPGPRALATIFPRNLEGPARAHELFAHRGVLGHDNAPEPHAPVHRSPVIGAEAPDEGTVMARHAPEEAPGPIPAPQGSDALAALPPIGLSALEAAMRRFLAQFDGSTSDPAAPIPDERWMWALAGGTLIAACETARRQFWRGSIAPPESGNSLAILSPIDPTGTDR